MRAACLSICLLLTLFSLTSCSRTPQQREARYLELGKKMLEKKDYARASLDFRNAIQVMPGDAEPYYQLGLTYL